MIKSVRLVNFFSFRDTTVSLEDDVTILIGLNGSGKTNFLRALQLLRAGMAGQLFEQIMKWGGFDAIFCRSKAPDEFQDIIRLEFLVDGQRLHRFGYKFQQDIRYCIQLSKKGSSADYYVSERAESDAGFKYLDLVNGSGMIYDRSVEVASKTKASSRKGGLVKVTAEQGDVISVQGTDYSDLNPRELRLGKIDDMARYPGATTLARALQSFEVYTEFDTSENSGMRRAMVAVGSERLLPNGSNLFQVLNTISINSTEAFDAIEQALEEVNSHFRRLRPMIYGNGVFEMQVQEAELKASTPAAHLSDGTLRYLCLLAIALNPISGALIALDEPERGLHPDMISRISRHLERRSEQSQIVLTTHLPNLLNQFPLRAVRVFDKDEGNQTDVQQFTEEDFPGWYDEFAPGQMWRDGALGGNR